MLLTSTARTRENMATMQQRSRCLRLMWTILLLALSQMEFVLGQNISQEQFDELVKTKFRVQALVAEQAATLIYQLSFDKKEAMTPEVLKMILTNNVVIDDLIYGSAIGFAPWTFNHTSNVQFEEGVPENETGMTKNGLYCPYVHADGTSTIGLDLAESYDYTNSTQGDFWYKPTFVEFDKQIKEPYGQRGKWSAPYFDEGGGDIEMITYSVPVKDQNGYFLAITTIDIDMEDVICTRGVNCLNFTCGVGFDTKQTKKETTSAWCATRGNTTSM